MQLPTYFLELTPKTWQEAKQIGNKLHAAKAKYIYRGQSDNTWPLETNLERLANRYSVNRSTLFSHEKDILKTFKSRAHHYITSPPANNDNIEWLSIIQDYGGPTRLLDFTNSFYIASFFGVESTNKDSCVWAISEIDLLAHPLFYSSTISSKYELDKPHRITPEFFTHIAETFVTDSSLDESLILKITPPRLNDRLSVQKGQFLFTCNLKYSFESNLCKTFKMSFNELSSNNSLHLSTKEFLEEFEKVDSGWETQKGIYSPAKVIKINISKELHREALRDLDLMNVNHASLFPGLEGFAKSLGLIISKKDIVATEIILHDKSTESKNN